VTAEAAPSTVPCGTGRYCWLGAVPPGFFYADPVPGMHDTGDAAERCRSRARMLGWDGRLVPWDARERLEQFVARLAVAFSGGEGDAFARDPEVRVVLWDLPDAAKQPRIATISLFYPDRVKGRPFGFGTDVDQNVVECGGILFAAERLMLAWIHEGEDGWGDDPVGEAETNMRDAWRDGHRAGDGR
jgi:hypothetical protein